ncbi:MAG: transporter [Clostridia bacterium]|nr:transporter [Clostridia bacterium]
MNVIEINNLTKSYGKTRGIVNVNFNVEEGEIFGFIGPNGAGKSTTIRTLLALIRPTGGSAKIFGKDCIKYAPEIAKEIGYLPSEVFYYENMKVMDILRYSASFYKKDCSKRIQELTDVMELDVTKKVDDLSFGNKKKVGIVAALLHEPRLIILDEPTSGLDPLMQQKFFELLFEENKKGAAILFSSHILTEVQKMCSRVAIIKDGSIVKVENINTLRENNYKRFNIEVRSLPYKNYFNFGGIDNLRSEGNKISFLYRGDINLILRKLSEAQLSNIWIEEPSLDEIFMRYYERED